MFHAPARARYDAAICHVSRSSADPEGVKTLAFDEGVECHAWGAAPFGAQLARTMARAYDIAGQGVAKPDSLIAAIRMAWNMGA